MILQCPSCASRFVVADALIPPEGRTVKCSKCTFQWHAERVGDETISTADFAAILEEAHAPVADAPPSPRQLPAISRMKLSALPFKIAAPVLAACWLVLALFAYFPAGQTGAFSGIYGMFGATDTGGLEFADIAMQREEMEGRTRFIVSGAIANNASEIRDVPYVRVQLKDKDSDVVWSQTYPVDQQIAPGDTYPFAIDNIETSFAGRATSMVLDLGNGFELMMR